VGSRRVRARGGCPRRCRCCWEKGVVSGGLSGGIMWEGDVCGDGVWGKGRDGGGKTNR